MRRFSITRRRKGLALSWDIVLFVACVLILLSIISGISLHFIQGARISKTQAETAQIGAAISQYRMEIGSFPSSMSSLRTVLTTSNGQYGPWVMRGNREEEWRDIWGHAFLYKLTNSGTASAPDYRSFVFYSAGPNGVDESNATSGIGGDDIGFWGK